MLNDLEESLAEGHAHTAVDIRKLRDVPVRISAVLGYKKMTIAELIEMESGAVLMLDKRVGEPIDLHVNDRLVARGELIVVDGKLGISITEIIKED